MSSYFYHRPKKKARIYQEKDLSDRFYDKRFGILCAVEDDKGMCFIARLPSNKRTLQKVTISDYGDLARLKSEDWEEVQDALNKYAEDRDLKELTI